MHTLAAEVASIARAERSSAHLRIVLYPTEET